MAGMAVPPLDLNAQHAPLAPEFTDAFQRVLASGRFILGAEVEALEAEVAALTGAAGALGVTSGTDALLLALMALGVGPGDEVIVPTFTFFATAGVVARLGATPVFADICPVCYNIDLSDVARRITPRTKVIIPVHLYGHPVAMTELLDFAEAHGIKVVEDAAQALGATYRGRPVGAMADLGAVSFYPTKNLGALGDAGMLLARDPELLARARRLRVHGMEPVYVHHEVGANFRMSAFTAAFLRVKLPHLADWNAARGRIAARYTEKLLRWPGVVAADPAACGCTQPAGEVAPEDARIVLPVAYEHVGPIWHQYTMRVPGEGERDRLKAILDRRGIGAGIYYPLTLDQQPCFAHLRSASGPNAAPRPVATRAATECLSLPIYPELDEARQDEVIAGVVEFLANP